MTQNGPAALNRIEYVPKALLPSVRAARVIKTKFKTVVAALRANTHAMPRRAEFLRSPIRLPNTLLNFTFTNLRQLLDAPRASCQSRLRIDFSTQETQKGI